MAGRTCTPPQRRMAVLMMASVVHVATGTQCPNTTVTSSRVVGAGSLQQMAAQSAEICCGHCVDDAACVAYTFDAKQSMCFLRDNLAQCGFKQEATSGVVHLANRTVKQGGACANEEQRPGYNWPPPSSSGSLWVLLVLLALVIAGGGALLVRNEKRRPDSSLSFPVEQVWHAACFSERSHLPEIVLLAYRLAVLLWALFVLLDSYPNMLFSYTIWNFIVLVWYFALASGHSLWGLMLKRGAVSGESAGVLQRLQLLLFEIELPTSLLIVVVVWGYLRPALHYGNPFPTSFDEISCHGLNAVAMLMEYALNTLAFRPSHVYFVALWPATYVLYQLFFLYPLSPNGHWAYPFMDTGTLWVVPWMLGLLALHVIIFGACLGCGRVIGRRPVSATPLPSMNATLITASQRQRRSADGRNQWLIGSQEYLEPMERVV